MRYDEKSTILIVDDNPANLHLLIEYLTSSGHNTIMAASGEEALEKINMFMPDLILLDILMPGMDGFETCRHIKANDITHDIPIIFMTALSDVNDKVKGFEIGGVDYITKPFQHKEVVARVNTHLMLRQLQQQLKEQNISLEAQHERLKEFQARKDMFFSLISRDLRNPFGSIMSLVQVAEKHLENGEHAQLAETFHLLKHSTENFDTLLDDLRIWADLQQEALEYHPCYLNLHDCVQQHVTSMLPSAERKTLTIHNRVPEDFEVYADKKMFDIIMRNLLSNAFKFTESGGSIDITAVLKRRFVELKVQDSGIGIAEEELQQLFRLDSRYKRPGTAGEEGTGLGLILCKELVHKNHGCIWGNSEPGQGSSFNLMFPRQPEIE